MDQCIAYIFGSEALEDDSEAAVGKHGVTVADAEPC